MSSACRCPGIARSGSRLGKWLRVLGAVRMLGAGVHLQLRELLAGEAVAGKHPFHRSPDDFGRPPVELLGQRPAAKPARITGVAVVDLRLALVPGDGDLLRVYDDDEVTGVDVMGELGLALAAQGVSDPGRQPAEGLTLGVDDVPLPLDLARFGAIGLHHAEKSADRASAEGRLYQPSVQRGR